MTDYHFKKIEEGILCLKGVDCDDTNCELGHCAIANDYDTNNNVSFGMEETEDGYKQTIEYKPHYKKITGFVCPNGMDCLDHPDLRCILVHYIKIKYDEDNLERRLKGNKTDEYYNRYCDTLARVFIRPSEDDIKQIIIPNQDTGRKRQITDSDDSSRKRLHVLPSVMNEDNVPQKVIISQKQDTDHDTSSFGTGSERYDNSSDPTITIKGLKECLFAATPKIINGRNELNANRCCYFITSVPEIIDGCIKLVNKDENLNADDLDNIDISGILNKPHFLFNFMWGETRLYGLVCMQSRVRFMTAFQHIPFMKCILDKYSRRTHYVSYDYVEIKQ